jgi:hypothetical protein
MLKLDSLIMLKMYFDKQELKEDEKLFNWLAVCGVELVLDTTMKPNSYKVICGEEMFNKALTYFKVRGNKANVYPKNKNNED